jgi:hypothetical protein
MMPMIDPGLTLIGRDGKAIPSNKAIPIPDAAIPSPNIGAAANVRNIPSPIGAAAPIAPTPQSLGQTNLPKISPADTQYFSDTYKDIYQNRPSREALQPHGLGKLANVLSSAALGPFAPLIYRALQDSPYQRAEHGWENRLHQLQPGLQFEEAQTREKGELARSVAREKGESERSAGQITETRRLREIQEANLQREIERDKEIKSTRDEEEKRKKKKDDDALKIRQDIEKRLTNKPLPVQERAFQLYTKRAAGEILTPSEEAEIKALDQIQKEKVDVQVAGAEARGKAYGQYRTVQVADDDTGNTRWEYAGDAVKGGEPTIASVPFQVLRGQALATLPTATVRTMAQRSQTIIPQMEAVSSQVDNLAKELGPLAGRWNELWVNKAGLNDPKFAQLNTNLELLSSAIALAHGLQGQRYVERLHKHFQEAQSPEDLKARIAAADAWITGYAGMVKKPEGIKGISNNTSKPEVKDPRVPQFDLSGVK